MRETGARMILQNISKAIREQNYYAVALEFVIVIAGVVIGFQINAWNEARTSSAREDAILDRLREGLVADQMERAQSANNQDRLERIRRSVQILFHGLAFENERSLCNAVVTSDFFSDASAPPTALAELISGDEGLSLISDPQLRSEITSYVQFRETLPRLVDWYARGSVDLDQVFPEYFQQAAEISPRTGRINPIMGCDVEAMRNDTVFLSAFAENAWRYEYYYASVVADHEARVARLIEHLDQRP